MPNAKYSRKNKSDRAGRKDAHVSGRFPIGEDRRKFVPGSWSAGFPSVTNLPLPGKSRRLSWKCSRKRGVVEMLGPYLGLSDT